MKRSLLYLLAVIIAAIVIIGIERPFESRVARNADEYLIPDYDTKDVAFIEIQQLTDGVKLKREGKNWIASDVITPLKERLYEDEGKIAASPSWHDADRTRVMSALGSISGLSKGVMVSKRADNHKLYRVGPAGIHVIALDDDKEPIFDIVIGKNGPDFTSNYVRFFDSDEVYLVGRVLTGIFSPMANDWIVEEPETVLP